VIDASADYAFFDSLASPDLSFFRVEAGRSTPYSMKLQVLRDA
jgi:hypothetical protein